MRSLVVALLLVALVRSAPTPGAAAQAAAPKKDPSVPKAPKAPVGAGLEPPKNNAAGADPLSLGASPPGMGALASNTLPPFDMLGSQAVVSPPLKKKPTDGLSLDIGRRIKQAEDLLNRMVWQLNRETSWANSVHDIIQNYQYKYTKVLSNIKKHSTATKKMRDLVSKLKKARLHEILEADLSKATKELQELAATSSKTSEDEGSYASLKDRAALIKADLEKMGNKKINKVINGVNQKMKQAAADAVPPASNDALKGLKMK